MTDAEREACRLDWLRLECWHDQFTARLGAVNRHADALLAFGAAVREREAAGEADPDLRAALDLVARLEGAFLEWVGQLTEEQTALRAALDDLARRIVHHMER